MHKFLSALVIAFSLAPPTQSAEAQCLLCGAVGYALGSSSGDHYSAAGGNVIYVAPRISERLLADPLEVRLIASSNYRITNGPTSNSLFADTVDNPEGYTILEVMRVIDPSNARRATFWFAYIENEKIKPVGALPPPNN